jgi:hypothetical protein
MTGRGSASGAPHPRLPPAWRATRLTLALLTACLALLWTTVSAAPASGAGASQPLPEHQLKAVYIYNLTYYIEWPQATNAPSSTPYVIGILGAPDVEAELRKLARDRKAKGRPLVIRRLDSASDATGCDIVYVAAPDSRRSADFLKAVTASRVITVGESQDFLSLGGIIRLYRKEDNVRLQIHLPNATKAGCTIHVRLLSAAEVLR